METDKLREEFLSFFREKGHKVFPSDSLVPDDPTVLFTSAGMNQFKPYFLGEKKGLNRATSCQKCLRTGDLEKVGTTAYHHTFFEMLGNFSFGDYFKKQAIEFAWEFLTQILNIPVEKLWVSVYNEDDEAYRIWKEYIGVTPEKIVKLGAEDNFWPANAPVEGPDGPCGPCSEIFFDWGKDKGCGRDTCSPSCSCGRFVEVWNLVFTQFNRVGVNKLEPLPQKNIDTGMGLERMSSVLQGKESNFDIDIIYPLVKEVAGILRVKEKVREDLKIRSSVNAIVDHLRASVFAVGDGVFPSNEDRGYVVRKLIRKASWVGYRLGKKEPFLFSLVGLCGEIMKKPYPEVFASKDNISEVIRNEEERFLSTIEGARAQFTLFVENSREKGKKVIEAQEVFKMYDTYGLPLELTRELASEHRMTIDEKGFYDLLEKQREKSRKKSMFKETIFTKENYPFDDRSEFVGYENFSYSSSVLRIIKGENQTDVLHKGEEGILVLDKTPFYAESGGQLPDKGRVISRTGVFVVRDVQKVKDAILHIGIVEEGEIGYTDVRAEVDTSRRKAIMRAHTATHLLQAALRRVLGEHVKQQGSLVDEDRFRFDFSHFKGLTDEEIEKVEEVVNDFILRGDAVIKEILPFEEARKRGALAFFTDKYAEFVRVVSIGDYSKELCGGTHLDFTSQVCSFCIVSESSISSGIRRIEAVVGREAYNLFSSARRLLRRTASSLKVKEDKVYEYVVLLKDELDKCRNKLEAKEKEVLSFKLDRLQKEKTVVQGMDLFIYELEPMGYASLLYLADLIRKRCPTAFIFLVSRLEGKTIFVCAITDILAKKGISASGFVKENQEVLGIKGGGKDISAQGVITREIPFNLLKKKIIEVLSTLEYKEENLEL